MTPRWESGWGRQSTISVGMLHIYPTMSEALKIAALAFIKDVSRLSCCVE